VTQFDFERQHFATRAKRNEAQAFARSILRDPEYRQNLLEAARKRTLAPVVEAMLYAYAYGKPPHRVEIGHPGDFVDFESLSKEELADRAKLLVAVLTGDEEAYAQLAAREAAAPKRLTDAERLAAAERITDGATFEPAPESEEGILRGPYNGGKPRAPRGGRSTEEP